MNKYYIMNKILEEDETIERSVKEESEYALSIGLQEVERITDMIDSMEDE